MQQRKEVYPEAAVLLVRRERQQKYSCPVPTPAARAEGYLIFALLGAEEELQWELSESGATSQELSGSNVRSVRHGPRARPEPLAGSRSSESTGSELPRECTYENASISHG